MKNSATVSVLDRASNLRHQLYATSWIAMQACSELLQAATGDVFHAEERQSVLAFADVVDRQNIWMIEVGCRFGFAPEPGKRVMRAGVIAEDAFEGDNAPGMSLARAINYAHAAASDLLEYLVIAHAPVFVRDLGFAEHTLEYFTGSLGVCVQSFAEKAIHTQTAVQPRSRSASLALPNSSDRVPCNLGIGQVP